MSTFSFLVFIGGWLHFCLLPAGMLVPFELNFRRELAKVDPLLRQLVWVYYVFIALSIIGFGVVSISFSGALTDATPLARAVCGFIALFWTTRLAIQFFVFDAKPHLRTRLLRFGYNALTLIFAYHAVVYGLVALAA